MVEKEKGESGREDEEIRGRTGVLRREVGQED